MTARDLPGLQHHFQFSPKPQQQQSPYQQPSSVWQNPPAPTGQAYTPYTARPYSGEPKNKMVAALLAFFLGGFGVHRFYLGHTGSGVAMLIICVVGSVLFCGLGAVVTGVWALIDFILILTGDLKDANGQSLQ